MKGPKMFTKLWRDYWIKKQQPGASFLADRGSVRKKKKRRSQANTNLDDECGHNTPPQIKAGVNPHDYLRPSLSYIYLQGWLRKS